MPRFTEDQIRAVSELIGLPRLTPKAVPARSSVAIDELRKVLDLPEPPHRAVLSENLWLGGSTIPRWLTGGKGMGEARDADLDFFVPSVAAFNESGRSLMPRGFSFRTFRSRWGTCQLCGGPAERIGGVEPDVPFLPPLERCRCPNCGDFGGPEDAAAMSPARLPRFTAQRLEERGILALELESPEGAVVHVSAANINPDPVRLCSAMDFSVVHFLLDARDLHFGRHAWTDLLTSRLRLVNVTHKTECYHRMRKYGRYGFRPYLGTRLKLELRHRLRL